MSAAATTAAYSWPENLPVFPCGSNKKPLVEGGFKNATRDAAVIRRWRMTWPDALPGVPTGHASGILVIDIDPRNGGDAWLREHWDALQRVKPRLHRTRSGGTHLLFAMPDEDLRCSTSKIAPGVDVRANGGYIVWWSDKPLDVASLPPPPDWLLEQLRAIEQGKAEKRAEAERKRAERIDDLLGVIPPPEGWTPDDVRDALWSIKPADSERDYWRNVSWAFKDAGGDRETWWAWSTSLPGFDPTRADEDALVWDEDRGGAITRQTFTYYARAAGFVPRAERPTPDDFPVVERNKVLRLVPLDTLATAEPVEPRFVIAPYLPRGFVTLFTGHGGKGKSMLSYAFAAHVACGVPFGDYPCERGRVLIVSFEDPASLVRLRLRRVIESYGLDVAEAAANLTVLEGEDCPLVTERNEGGARFLVELPALEDIREHAAGHSLIILDGASDAFDANENDRRLVRRFVRGMLQPLAAKSNAAVLLLAHVDKAGVRHGTAGESYSGSTAWHNSARSRIALASPKPEQLELRHEKHNLTAPAEPLLLEAAEHGVIRPLSEARRMALDSADTDTVLDAFAKVSTDVPTAASGPRTAWHVLEAYLPEKWKPDRLRDALIVLERAGRLRREKYRTASRHSSERWVVSDYMEAIGDSDAQD